MKQALFACFFCVSAFTSDMLSYLKLYLFKCQTVLYDTLQIFKNMYLEDILMQILLLSLRLFMKMNVYIQQDLILLSNI
ncbi:Uncharacterised protein [Mycobacteroides abscessus subsp. massiliense]|nr:Uncharacterised protein [Mycobacteroides abscessus subsp. massiliense]